MLKRNKRINVIAAMVVGVIFILGVLLALLLSGVTRLQQTELTFSTDSMEALYDGTPLTNHTWHMTSGNLKKGHSLSVSVVGEQTDVGESPNTIEVRITDELGADVTGDYQIHYRLGTLKVSPRDITVASASAEKIHDGFPLIAPSYTITSEHGRALVLSHTATVDVTGNITEVGEVFNEISSIQIQDSTGKDVTANYRITLQQGILRVNVRIVDLEIATTGREMVYDGTTLTAHTWSIKKGQLKPGHQLNVVFTGEQTNIGQSDNTIDITVTDNLGNDVTNEYAVTYDLGKLTITPRQIEITSLSAQKIYDGSPLTQNRYIITSPYENSLPSKHAASVDITGTITEVGETDNIIQSVMIRDAYGNNVTSNYQITIKHGKLRVFAEIRSLVIRTESADKLYDGFPLTSEKWALESGELKKGHSLLVSFLGEQIGVGQSKNYAEIKIVDNQNKDVTNEYDITCYFGTLTVTPRFITVISESAEKRYDGTPLTAPSYIQFGHELAPGHRIIANITGSIVNVGETLNTVQSLFIVDGAGSDVSINYQITIKEGVLRVTFNETDLVFSTPSVEKIYDGTPLTCHQWNLELGTLKSGHRIQVAFAGSQTNVGESKNDMVVTIVNDYGHDVTDQYHIYYHFGTLMVNPRALTVTSGDAEKEYDGSPLQNLEYTLSELPLVNGHTIKVDIIGFIVNVGKTFNDVANVFIYDAYGVDVSRNYQITIREGTLSVLPSAGDNGGSGSGSGSGSGAATGNLGGTATDFGTPLLNIKSDVSGHVYLKQTSFGTYTGQSWTEARPYGELLDGYYGYQYLTAIALEQNGIPVSNFEIEFLSSFYMLPYYLSMQNGNCEIQASDVWNSGSCDALLSFWYTAYSGYGNDLVPLSGEYAIYEQEYRRFVYDQYLEIDEQSLAYMQQIIKAQHFNSNDPNIVSRVALYIKNAATYNLDYDQTMNQQENVVIAFLETYQEGICQHYASAATLLFRALGIPARYTVGFTGDTKAGEWTTVTTPGHAWTEVYIDGIGWIPVEVTGSANMDGSGGGGGGGGDLVEPDPTIYEIVPVPTRKQYDGSPLYPIAKLSGLDKLLNKGYRYEVIVSGSRTELGISESYIESFILYDPTGADVTNSFYFKYKTGTIQVYHSVLQFESESVTKVYDGVPLSSGVMTGGSLMPGHTFSVVCTTPTTVGYHANLFTVTVVDAEGTDVTSYYYIQKNCGTVSISPIQLTIKAADAKKAYDGTPLTCNEASIVQGALLEGHCIASIVLTGSQTSIGRSENVVSSIVIVDAEGNDVTANYQIEFQNGTLRVTYS